MDSLRNSLTADGDLSLPDQVGTPPPDEHRDGVGNIEPNPDHSRILVVEDEPGLVDFYTRVLREKGMTVVSCCDGHECLEKLSVDVYDLVILDINLPSLDGISLARWIQRHRPTLRMVVISGDISPDRILAAMRAGAMDYLPKPFTFQQFLEMIDRAIQPRHSSSQQLFSSLMRQVMHDVREEIVGLEIMTKLIGCGKFGAMDPGVSKEIDALGEKVEQLKGLTADYCILARNLFHGGDIPTERIGLKSDVITHVLGELRPALARKAIRVVCDSGLPKEDDAYVMGNSVMLRGLFRTLFSNAVRHCNNSGTLTYGITDNGRRYKIQVANEGDIVPVHQQERIFEEFFEPRPGDSASCPEEDLSLGLAMAKSIVHQHGGDIWYESVPNGSKFVCTLPAIVALNP